MKKLTIIGAGTAGLISALMIRKAFPSLSLSIVASSEIGIIGVGEGSTEHWKMFMDICDIPLAELLIETSATHKNGIRFENWTKHTPDYFHSVSYADRMGPFQVYGLYNGLISQGKLLTENISPRAMIENKVNANNPHQSVNQYHFDTFKLNTYLKKLCIVRNIKIIDDKVINVNLNSLSGNIESIDLEKNKNIESDFWIDASGQKKVLMSVYKDNSWISFSDYLQMDSAIAFPTESDPSGQIRPYTRARAMKNGWVWEIPTLERRGNGYVFSSRHCTTDQAVDEVSILLNRKIEPARIIKFDPGYLSKMWIKNCVAIGLASSFVEPIEATSIGSTIQQVKCLIQNLCTFDNKNIYVQDFFNNKMSKMMENILAMVSLHYISDRTDSEMWIEQSNIEKPEYLNNLLTLWSERPPFFDDIPHDNFELFWVPHFYHVANGQGVLSRNNSSKMIQSFNISQEVQNMIFDFKLRQTGHAKVDHGEALRQIQI